MNRTSDAQLLRRGLLQEYATLAWNVIGMAVLAVAARRADSVGLAGLGLDSLIEIFASVVVIWRLRGGDPGRERLALWLIGGAFILLALYIAVLLLLTVMSGVRPSPSGLGLIWLAATCLTMLTLAWGKDIAGHETGNLVLIAQSRATLIVAILAFAVLIGLGLNAGFGWWWADPFSGLVVLGYAVKQGRAAWRLAGAPIEEKTPPADLALGGEP